MVCKIRKSFVNFADMKKCHYLTIVFCGLAAFFGACSSDVELIADGEDVPIIYALLDSKADTNYVKITHTMGGGDAIVAANHPELSNYPGKLDARLTEYCNGDSIRQIILDTITIHDKEGGTFYAPEQKLYYTTERLGMNSSGKQYSYKLTVVLPDHTLTANAKMVGSDGFYIRSAVANFSGGYPGGYSGGSSLFGQNLLIVRAMNAGIYDVYMSFTFLERRTFDSDTIPRTVTWHMGQFYLFDIEDHMNGDAYELSYRASDLYVGLKNYLGDDTLVPGLRRYIIDDPISVTVTAGGEDLSEYIYLNELNSNTISDENIHTHINGGFGVFDSKMTVSRTLRLGGTTVPELVENTNWGFKYIGGHL